MKLDIAAEHPATMKTYSKLFLSLDNIFIDRFLMYTVHNTVPVLRQTMRYTRADPRGIIDEYLQGFVERLFKGEEG